jgi:hypothetical protein
VRLVVPLGAGHDDHDCDNEDGADSEVDAAMGDTCASSSSGTHKH